MDDRKWQIRGWMIEHDIPLDAARNIMLQIKYHKLVDDINTDEEVDLKYIFSILFEVRPMPHQSSSLRSQN